MFLNNMIANWLLVVHLYPVDHVALFFLFILTAENRHWVFITCELAARMCLVWDIASLPLVCVPWKINKVQQTSICLNYNCMATAWTDYMFSNHELTSSVWSPEVHAGGTQPWKEPSTAQTFWSVSCCHRSDQLEVCGGAAQGVSHEGET